MFFTNSVKLYGFFTIHFTVLHVTIHFSSDFIFSKTVYQFSKALKFFYVFLRLLLRKILEILQFFQYTKIYEAMENVGIALFYRICVVAAIITMGLLILEILREDESLTSTFHFLCKAIVPVYYSVYLPLLFHLPLEFIKAILKEYEYCKKVMKRHFNKNLVVSEEEEQFQLSNTGWICKKLIDNDDQKARDHCHITGKLRGAVHSSRNTFN